MGTSCRSTVVVCSGGAGFHWDWLCAVLLVLGAFVLFFFRDPERTSPSDPDLIVSPADGRVMEVVDEARGESSGRRISIFLSIFDVHVNRAPVAGKIAAMEYRKGRFYAAMRGRASEENEQNVIHVATERGRSFSNRSPAGSRGAYCAGRPWGIP